MTKPNKNKQSKHHLNISHPKNKRADCAWVLHNVLENGRSLSELLPIVFERYEPKERAWLQEMIFGCLRNLPRLQIWLRELLDKPLKNKQKIIENLLMLGMYQLTYSRTAEHAAVSETVETCKKLGEHRLAGLVNAVLRNFQREDTSAKPIDSPHAKLGLPKWLHKKLSQHYQNDYDMVELANNMHTRAPLWLRVNILRTSMKDFVNTLKENGYEFECFEPHTIKLTSSGDIPSIPGFDDGFFAVQDFAAQQASLLLNAQPNDVVIDCCAAPGGKTAAILESQSELTHLYVLDSDSKRMERVHENLNRLGHTNTFGDKLSYLVEDASALNDMPNLPMFDKILLDAPCSATGVIRRHPDIMWLRKPSDIEVLVNLQANILEAAWQKLKAGGELLYATCSILPEENQQQIESFIAKHNEATLVPIHTIDGSILPTWQILPGENGMDGFFYAKIKKAHSE